MCNFHKREREREFDGSKLANNYLNFRIKIKRKKELQERDKLLNEFQKRQKWVL